MMLKVEHNCLLQKEEPTILDQNESAGSCLEVTMHMQFSHIILHSYRYIQK